MGAIAKLAHEMATYYSEEKLVKHLTESDHEIIQEIGQEVLDEEGFPDWARLKDVNYVVELVSSYSFKEWAELSKALFNIDNIAHFAKHEMYDLFTEFIRLFDINIRIKTDPNEFEG